MFKNIAEVYASFCATTLRNASGQNASLSVPARHRLDLSTAVRSFNTAIRSIYN